MTNPVLTIEKLSKQFTLHTQNGAVLDALSGISLDLGSGEILALCGTSGAGKSSLLKCVYGTYRITGGRILVTTDGSALDLSTAGPREIMELRRLHVGYVSQFLRVIPRVPAIDIVANAAIDSGADLEEAHEVASRLLKKLRIPEALFGLSPLTFSGGEQQRVNIARAMAAPKPLMLLDEPTASLDICNRETVLEMIRGLADNGVAVLGIFHNPEDREALGAREIHLVTEEVSEDA